MRITKRFLLKGCVFFMCCVVNAQEFDKRLSGIAKEIAEKVNKTQKKKIAIWGFASESGEQNSALGNYLTEDFSVYVTNFGEDFEVIDRNHLDIILKEHKLNAEGYIDQETAKELGKIAAVDAIITGTYSLLPTRVKVRVKVLDTETALQFAANIGDLPINRELRGYLNLDSKESTVAKKEKDNSTLSNSNESIDTSKEVDSECKTEKFGDFCFKNTSEEKVVLYLTYSRRGLNLSKTIFIESEETKCLYKFQNGIIIKYYIATYDTFNGYFNGRASYLDNSNYINSLKDSGELKAETCKSKVFTIK